MSEETGEWCSKIDCTQEKLKKKYKQREKKELWTGTKCKLYSTYKIKLLINCFISI